MPGLLRGAARTAVIAGTATAASGRVQRRQAERFASRDAQIDAARDAAYEEQMPQAQYASGPAAPTEVDTLAQLQQLADLRNQGMLTEEEFAAAKAKILGK